jgi:hypothetical protein
MQVGEDLLNDTGVPNPRDDSHRTAAGRAGLDADTEHLFQALRQSHRGVGCLGVRYGRLLKRWMV